ncbi:MAG: DUF2891 domain-containing protein [Bacteroidales bacterium]|nr:DUF2891 domain-containing protein [Bacteroidales bacterium]
MNTLIKLSILASSLLMFISSCDNPKNGPATEINELTGIPELTMEAASNFANIALNCIQREYPNKLSHVMNDSTEVLSPKELHPVFYGCFDWHSSVHGHWMLVKLLKTFPDLPESQNIRNALSQNLSKENIQKEVNYLYQSNRASFERTYGWSWLLKLTAELYAWDDKDGKQWLENLQPLADAIEERYIDFLPKQEFPIRRGVHPNTAFGISFALDYAIIAEKNDLKNILTNRAKEYFIYDENIGAAWEPDGDDFLSPSLMEADLMSRILKKESFSNWFNKFLPLTKMEKPNNLLHPVSVSDRSDPKIVHLDGLNLSRAWCMFRISKALPDNNPAKPILYQSAIEHANATIPYIATGNYEGEHWLASFAVYMLNQL